MSEFDVSKFQTSNSKSSSNVKSFATEHSYRLTENDLQIAIGDLFVIIPLTGFIGLNLAYIAWQWASVPISLICPVLGIVVSLVAILRYQHTMAYQGQANWSRGKLLWEHVQNDSSSNGKAYVKFVRESNGHEVATGNELKLNSISYEKLLELANVITSQQGYNQRLLSDNQIVTPRNYDLLSQELLDNRIIKYKSDNPRHGYEVTERGLKLMSTLAKA